MKIEDQVCSLELAKKLKELGVGQHSLFYWRYVIDLDYYILGQSPLKDSISAFTVAELGDMLPYHAKFPNGWGELWQQKGPNGYWTAYQDKIGAHAGFCADIEANARAEMLIYLIENKLMDVK